jgi:hypothetical protein
MKSLIILMLFIGGCSNTFWSKQQHQKFGSVAVKTVLSLPSIGAVKKAELCMHTIFGIPFGDVSLEKIKKEYLIIPAKVKIVTSSYWPFYEKRCMQVVGKNASGF